MIYTSYFANIGKLPSNYYPVSISLWNPKWLSNDSFSYYSYKKLAPSSSILSDYKKDGDEEKYDRRYKTEILGKLNTHDTAYELLSLLPSLVQEYVGMFNCPFWSNPDVHIVLMCYEKAGDFCHRSLVSTWLNEHGIRCSELSKNDFDKMQSAENKEACARVNTFVTEKLIESTEKYHEL